MRVVYVAEITAYDPQQDKLVVLHACTAGHGPVVYGDEDEYVPCISTLPVYSFSLPENGEPGSTDVDYGSLGLMFSAELRNEHWRGFDFDGYPCRIRWGEYGADLDTFTEVPAGRCGSLAMSNAHDGEFPLLGPDSDLKKEVLNVSYAGSGGAEGLEDRKGQLKPFSVGFAENLAPQRIDEVYLVYQYHGHGRTGDVVAVYENALTLSAPAFTVPSYEALIGITAEQLPPGTWAKAPAVGMFRLGAEPLGKITADVYGAMDGNKRLTSFGEIACWMLREYAGVPANMIDTESAAKLDRDFPHVWGDYLDSRDKPEDESEPAISVGDFLRDAAGSMNMYLLPDELGVWRFGRITPAKEPTTIQESHSTWPVVLEISKPAAATRVKKVRVGGRRCFSVHSDNEISSALKEAIEEGAIGGGAIGAVQDDINDLRGEFSSLVLPLIQEPIARVEALHLEYGAAQLKATQALHKQNHIAIETLGVRVDENGSLVAEKITQLTSRVQNGEDTVEAGLKEIRQTIANQDFASVEDVTTMIARYGKDVDAAIVEEARVRVEKDNALAESIRLMGVRVGSSEGQITDLNKLIVTERTATAESLRQMGVRISGETGARESAIQTLQKTMIDRDNQLAQRIDTISVSNGTSGLEAAIKEEREARISADTAIGRRIDTISVTDYSGQIASIQQNMSVQASQINGLRAQYVIKVDNNGVISGFGLASDSRGSEFLISADRLVFTTYGGTVTPFRVQGDKIYMTDVVANNIKVKNAMIDQLTIHGDRVLPFTLSQSMRYMWDGHNSDNVPSESSGLAMASVCYNTQYQWVDLAPSGPVQGTLNYVADGSRVLIWFSLCSRQTGSNDDAYKFRVVRNDGYVLPTTPWMCYTTGKAISQAWQFIDDNLGGGSSAGWQARTYRVQALRPGNQNGRLLACSLIGFVANK